MRGGHLGGGHEGGQGEGQGPCGGGGAFSGRRALEIQCRLKGYEILGSRQQQHQQQQNRAGCVGRTLWVRWERAGHHQQFGMERQALAPLSSDTTV